MQDLLSTASMSPIVSRATPAYGSALPRSITAYGSWLVPEASWFEAAYGSASGVRRTRFARGHQGIAAYGYYSHLSPRSLLVAVTGTD